jgi:FkbM family methyltransferase
MRYEQLHRREIAFRLCRALERRDVPGAWRLRHWLLSTDFAAHAKGVVRCSTNHGFDILIDPAADKGVERSIVNEGTYEEGTLQVMSKVLRTGCTFLDIGANVGLMSLFASRLVGATGAVHSFEPLPEVAALLEASAQVNGLGNIQVHRIALGAEASERTLHRNPQVNRGSASLAWGSAGGSSTEVRVDSLDHWAQERPLHRVAMVKIDVEGWELEVLRGGLAFFRRPEKPVVCIEFSDEHPLQGGTLGDLYTAMTGLGYRAYVLSRTKAAPSPLRLADAASLPRHDNVFFFPADRPARQFGLECVA